MDNSHIRQEDEIDLVAIFRKLSKSKKSIIWTTAIFMAVGLVFALFADRKYEATTLMIYNMPKKKEVSGLTAIASLSCVRLKDEDEEALDPKMLEKIVGSTPFQMKIAKTPLTFQKLGKKLTYEDYVLHYNSLGVVDYILNPLLLFSGSGQTSQEMVLTDLDSVNILTVDEQTQKVIDRISHELSFSFKEREGGYFEMKYKMSSPLPAAQMLLSAQQELQRRLTEFRVERAERQLLFLEKEYQEIEQDFLMKQALLERYKKENKAYDSLPIGKRQQLETDYNLAYGLYAEVKKQIATQRILLKDIEPPLTVIEPVKVPSDSKSNRGLIFILFAITGLVISVCRALITDYIKQVKERENHT